MIEVTHEAATRRLTNAQARSESAGQAVLHRRGSEAKPQRFLTELRAYLEQAYNKRVIKEPLDAVMGLLKMSDRIPDEKDPSVEYVAIGLGEGANFKNVAGTPRLTRTDGAWFDFRMQIAVRGDESEILAYAFDLRLPDHPEVWHVRIDLNGPRHANENLGLRSHVHLNVDDEGYSIPSPILAPVEVLDLLLFSLRPEPGARKRAPRSVRPAVP